jgi:methionyl-tRNA synthetase
VGKYFDGTLPVAQAEDAEKDAGLVGMLSALRGRYEEQMEHYAFQNALAEVFKVIGRANKYIDENAPWVLAKDMEANGARLARVMYNLLETLRISAVLLTPFIPQSAAEVLRQIGACECCSTWESAAKYGSLSADVTVSRGDNLFPRIDAEKALAELEAAAEAAKKAALPALEVEPFAEENVDFDTFCKSDFRAVKVKACENVKKSDKLLKFTLDDGTGEDRQILSGIAKWYKPEDLVGKTLMAIVNLPPRKMMGQMSCGMLISAVHTEKGEEVLNLLMLDDKIPAGAKMC